MREPGFYYFTPQAKAIRHYIVEIAGDLRRLRPVDDAMYLRGVSPGSLFFHIPNFIFRGEFGRRRFDEIMAAAIMAGCTIVSIDDGPARARAQRELNGGAA